jgi:GNAT superfamily N-acetyltransferase
MIMTTTLPTELALRAPELPDAQEIADLVNACELADCGSSDTDSETIQDFWGDMDLAKNAFVIVNAQGQIIGYTGIKHYGQLLLLDPNTNVRLDYRGRNLEAFLLQLAEERGRALWAEAGSAGLPQVKTWSSSETWRSLLEQRGYTVKSSDMSMKIDLRDYAPAIRAVAGVEIGVAHLPQDERAVHFVIQEAFQDIGGYPYRPFEEWREGVMERPTFDPTMLYVARDEEQIIGAAVCSTYRGTNTGFVNQIAIARAYRQRGIALVLLQTVFAEYARRGIASVDLTVDAHNVTGAHQLYAKAGMRCVMQIDEMYHTLE